MASRPTIETARLRLRPWTLSESDIAAFHAIWSDPEVIWWGPSKDIIQSEQTLRQLLGRCPDTEGLGCFALIDSQSGEIVGNAMLDPAFYMPDTIELGYHLARRAWGRGIATEAAGALVEHGLRSVGLPRIVATVHVDNARSHRVIGRLGFRPIGEIMRAGLPHVLYEKRREDGAA